MKLLELKIENFRGIKNLEIKPNAKNIIIEGENGSGKSSVTDALDFLLTGEITHLKGTKGISQKRHGPHIDTAKKLANAKVIGIFKLPNVKQNITVTASLDGKKEFLPKDENAINIFKKLKNGIFLLSRRMILEFVTSAPKKRGELIEKLLNLSDIETVRQQLKKFSNSAKSNFNTGQGNLKFIKKKLSQELKLNQVTESEIIQKINTIHDATKIPKIKSYADIEKSSIFTKLNSPPKVEDKIRKKSKNFGSLLDFTQSSKVVEEFGKLSALLYEWKNTPKLSKQIKESELIKRGLMLLAKNEMASCPLCDTTWNYSELKEYLTKKQKKCKEAKAFEKNMLNSKNRLANLLFDIKSHVNEIFKIISEFKLKSKFPMLANWQLEMERAETYLDNKIDEKFSIQSINLDNLTSTKYREEIVNLKNYSEDSENGLREKFLKLAEIYVCVYPPPIYFNNTQIFSG